MIPKSGNRFSEKIKRNEKDAQAFGDSPSPGSLRSPTSPRKRGEVKRARGTAPGCLTL